MPIRDEALAYSPVINSVERGVSYVQAATQQIRDARFYASRLTSDYVNFQVAQVNLYAAGVEDQTGPIQQVLIPCKSVTSTGANISFFGSSLTDALYQSGDTNKYVTFNYSAASQRLSLYFDISAYPVLANKRILNVSLAYSGSAQDTTTVNAVGGAVARPIDFVHPDDGTSMTVISQMDDLGNAQQFLGAIPSNTGSLRDLNTVIGPNGTAHDNMSIAYLDLGDINNAWSTGAAIGVTGAEKLPWRYLDLLRFEPSFPNVNRQHIDLSVALPLTENGFPAGTGNDVLMTLDYAALRVIYCEEKRTAYGGQQFGYSYGMNKVTLRDLGFAADPIVPAGTYLPTLSFVSPGQVVGGGNLTSDFPDLNATRQLYQIPSHPATEVDIPFPLAERLGETFTSKASFILPQLSLHASGGGPLTEPHVYGRQLAAQVYGVNTATQGIYDIGVAAASYPQVRYYARRFGDTTIPLTLGGCSDKGMYLPGNAAATASTPDAASLDIVGDIEMTCDAALNNWAPGGSAVQVLVCKGDSLAQFAYRLAILGTGEIQFVWNSGSINSSQSLPPVAPGSCNRLAVRVTVDVNDGGGNSIFTFYTAPTAAGPFTQLGAPRTQAATSILATTSTLVVGNNGPAGAPFSDEPAAGRIYFAEVRNGIAGTVVANPNFNAQAVGTTSFNDTAVVPKTWTLNGAAAIVAGNTGSTASITVSEFDQLPEILDGWREVTLRFSTPPTMGGGAEPTYGWSATGETAGNRWEILGAAAPAISGVPGSLYTQVPSAQRLGAATYQPTRGTALNLSWMPQGVASGWVTGAGADPSSDAVLIFSQDPATITGVSITQLTQPVSGIGTLCGSLPCCIPSGIGYNRLAWTASNLPITGFGAYELQRYDSVVGDFQTIMLSTTVSGTGFSDFEARSGGVVSVYRIRTLNALNFAGAWSAQVSGTGTAPGITIAGTCDSSGALIFTSNGDQTGANNAAYVMQWDNIPTENFDLFEADSVQYQPMYGRAGRVAFHGTERGLEEFSRVVLLQAGAIALPSLADAADIRDLAWDDLPYVCVRDGRGNRWFANVRVPNVNARNNAQNYLARLDIVETTQTAYPVNP